MLSSQDLLTENYSLLKIGIDNNWSADDFYNLFGSINRLYGYHLLLIQAQNFTQRMGNEYNIKEIIKKFKELPDYLDFRREFKINALKVLRNPNPNFNATRLNRYFPFAFSDYPLTVNKVKFGSKGTVDLLGIGKVFEVMKELIMNYVPNESDKLDNLLKEKEVEEKVQKILQMRIENLKNIGLETDEILQITGFESTHLFKIKSLIDQDKIQGLEIDK